MAVCAQWALRSARVAVTRANGADAARLWVAAQPPPLLEEEVLDVGVIIDGCSATLNAAGCINQIPHCAPRATKD